MHDIAMRLDEGQPGSSGTVGPRAHGAHRLGQVLEKGAFALARAGDGKQIVAEALLWQGDRNRGPGMTGGTELPAITLPQRSRGQGPARMSAVHRRQVGQ